MEEAKYYQRFHQANMSHLLSVFNKSKSIMIVNMLSRWFIEHNFTSGIVIITGYVIMALLTQKLEKASRSNEKSVILLTHFINTVKILS